MTTPGELLLMLFWTTATVAAYLAGLALRRWTGNHPLANPALIAIGLVSFVLLITKTEYATYLRATWLLTFLLGPATVALGVPLAKNLGRVQKNWRGVALGLSFGCVTSMLSGVFLVRALGGSKSLAMSMLPKSVTTPIAMAVAKQVGGEPALTATLAILGGIIAAITFRKVFGLLKVTNEEAIGLAAGTAGSGIAAAQVAQLGDGPAAFAAVGIGLNGLLTALLAPLLAQLLG